MEAQQSSPPTDRQEDQDAEELGIHQKLLRLGGGVCCVEVPLGWDGKPCWGTGFHYGGGWVVTNAHGLMSNEIAEKVRFVFSSVDGSLIVFDAMPCPGL